MSEEKKELQAEYKELYDKNPSNAWSEEKLKELIEAKKNNPTEDFMIDPKKTYVFELQGEFKEMKRLQIQPSVSTMCEETGKRRMLRLCQYESSPYLDEQDEDAKPFDMPITFTRGSVVIDGKDAYKIRYLLATDYLYGKENILQEHLSMKNVFKLKDEQKEIDANLDNELAILEAKQVAAKADISSLENFLRGRYGSSAVQGKTEKEIRIYAIQRAQEQPALFNKDFNNPKHKLKAIFQKAEEKGIIKEVDSTIVNKQGAVVYRFESRYSFDEALARWILEDKGKEAKEFLSLIEGQL